MVVRALPDSEKAGSLRETGVPSHRRNVLAGGRMRRRAAIQIAMAACLVTFSSASTAEDVVVPVPLQIALLTASAVASQVTLGIVLGFDLVSGKPKLLVHLGQARRQHVDLSAEVLKLMRVVA